MTTAAGLPDARVPGYLGRVLDDGDAPVGTCFQVAPRVLVTAWHVLEDIGAAEKDARIGVDPLAGGAAFQAAVARLDQDHDLTVLISDVPLPGTAGELAATDQMAPRAGVTVTGHAVITDPGRTARSLTTIGQWTGPATWQDATPTGRMTAEALMPGMSGAPVIRDSDGAVAGVVSGRYNTADGWLAGTVWVARTEDLAALLDGITEVTMKQAPLSGPVDLVLTVTAGQVRLTGGGIDVSAGHGGVSVGLAEAVNEGRRARARAGLAARSQAGTEERAEQAALGRASGMLSASFVPAPVAKELGRVLAAAERAHQLVRLGLAVPPELAGLPWEALAVPETGQPLALHPLVSVYRKADAAGPRVLPGPLRIIVAIAAPDSGSPLLDYERELRNVLAAVRDARQGAADVRVVPFATVAGIRDELDRGPAHILHLSGHGSPGTLYLENDDGSARAVTANEFVDQTIPPGQMPPVITLAACYTDAAASQDGTSFAARLCARGATAVIATETSITDTYATRLLARVYGTLARTWDPDIIAALAEARRQVQAELETSPDERDNELAGLGEWAAVTILAAAGSVPVLDVEHTGRAAPGPSRPRIAGLATREDWYFVGRRREQRRWPADLTRSSLAGIVICGIGGTGKTTLAAEITTRVRDREPGRVLVSLTGPLTLEHLLGAMITTIRRELLISGQDDAAAIQALDVAGRADLGWQDRLAILRGHVLDHVPVLVLLDNFEDNLRPDGDARYAVSDQVLAALLAAWVTDPGQSRLLVTCRYSFALPGGAEQALSFRQLGALSRAETMKLAWSLPALDRLDGAQLEQVWRLAGGHPRSLEYLDALLSDGEARYPDVTDRLNKAITRRLSGADRGQWLAARTGLEAALAETVALAADDILLEDLLARLAQIRGAAGLLLGVSVYREAVDRNAVLFVAGQPDPDAERIPDRQAAYQAIENVLAAAGITVDESFDLAAVPNQVQAQLAPHLAELNRRPAPPFRPPPGLDEQVAACQAASLLTVSGNDGQPWFFVHRWTAAELAGRAAREPGSRLAGAHRQAAAYWLWRVRVWPQDQAAEVHDLLEARFHLLQAGDTEAAGQVTEEAARQLHTRGAWDQEASLIHDTLARLPADSPRQAFWIHRLGLLAQDRGDFDEATSQYQRALEIAERLGHQADMAFGYHQLGRIAHLRGDYDEATNQYQRAQEIYEQLGDQSGIAASNLNLGVIALWHGDFDKATNQYQRALDTFERLGNQVGMASSYGHLGAITQRRGDYDKAAPQYQRALEIYERLGDQVGIADIYGQLGTLAQDRGDYDEAARQYQRAQEIYEQLGNQGKMAIGYHQLGTIARRRGDYDEATRQYQRALDIFERIGDQPNIATCYHNLGVIAQHRGDYDEAARQYQRALDIQERIGNPVGIASSYSALGGLEKDRGGSTTAAFKWHMEALVIRLHLGVPQAVDNLRSLSAYRRELGAETFTRMLTKTVDNADLAETITSLLDQVDETGGETT